MREELPVLDFCKKNPKETIGSSYFRNFKEPTILIKEPVKTPEGFIGDCLIFPKLLRKSA
jgi:hypothetical protein